MKKTATAMSAWCRMPRSRPAWKRAWRPGIGFGNIYPSVMSSQPGAAAYLKGHFGGQVGEQLCASGA